MLAVSNIILEEHVNHCHKLKELLSCDQCDFDTENSSALKEHIDKNVHDIHNRNKSFGESGDVLKETHSVNQKTPVNTQMEDNFPVESNSQTVPQSKDKVADVAIMRETPPINRFICGQCSKSFDTIVECNTHVQSHKSKCYKCEFESDDKMQMKLHEKTQHVLPCDHTGECNMTNHTSNKKPSNQCDVCEEVLENQDQLLQHKKIHQSTSQQEQPPMAGNYSCKKCDFTSVYLKQLWDHNITAHEGS